MKRRPAKASQAKLSSFLSELNDSWVPRRADNAKGCLVDGAVNRQPLWVVQRIEKLRAELGLPSARQVVGLTLIEVWRSGPSTRAT